MTASSLSREDIAEIKQWRPQTDDELHAWIQVCLGVHVPRKSVCENHCAPFEPLADIYFGRVSKAFILGPRGGGKTLNSAISHYLDMLHLPGCEAALVGAIRDQADRAYNYLVQFTRDDVEAGLCDPPTRKQTKFTNQAWIQVLTGASKKAVNGPHPDRATMDEFELMDWDVFTEALLMMTERPGIPSALVLTSTRKEALGNVQKMMKSAKERGFKIYEYCGLDVAEPCLEEVRSCEDCKDIVKYDHHNQPVSFFDVCQGRMRHSAGHFAIGGSAGLIQKFREQEVEKYLTQLAPCSEPSRGDACFSEFASRLHEVAPRPFDPRLPIGTGWDFGISDPMSCHVFQWDGPYCWVIDELGSDQMDPRGRHGRLVDEVAAELLERPYSEAILRSRYHFGDPAGKQRGTYMKSKTDTRSAFKVLRGMGIRIRGKSYPNPSRRIEAMKLMLRIDDALGKPRLFITRRCPGLLEALKFAQWAEGREHYVHDEHSHPLDSCGYFIDGMWPPKSYHGKAKARCHT